MALLSTYTSTNKELDELPKDVNLFLDAWVTEDGGMIILFNTTHTERYRYVGMTAAAAALCQTAMIALYTETINGVTQCVADVSATRQNGHMWQVSVSVMRVSVTSHYQAPA
jgi:uncharacterized membrane protein HdeD (DUF308 family)